MSYIVVTHLQEQQQFGTIPKLLAFVRACTHKNGVSFFSGAAPFVALGEARRQTTTDTGTGVGFVSGAACLSPLAKLSAASAGPVQYVGWRWF